MGQAYEPPTFRQAAIPPAIGAGMQWVQVCDHCEAVVANSVGHSQWHVALWVALSADANGPTP